MSIIDMHSADAFLSLVRRGIGHEVLPIKDYDWASIKSLADKQGLSAIVLDGIESLPDNQRPPKGFILQWIGEVLQSYNNRYIDYERAIGELAGFYNKNGIKMMVLKGYGLSLNYPQPSHRPCGDIDIWNYGRQKEADNILTKELGIPVDSSKHLHTVFYWKNYIVENHYDMLVTSSVKTNKELDPILKELAMDDSNSVIINGEKVYLPSANFNALFLLRHMLMHFVACGINLRNVLDWAFFWEKEGEKVDIVWLKGIVEQYHMDAFFNIVNAICIDDLGFAPNVFPSVQFNPTLKERVLKDTLAPEYDWKDAHRLGFLKRLLFKYKRWKAGAWKRELCYGESNWASFWMSIWSHVLKPSSI